MVQIFLTMWKIAVSYKPIGYKTCLFSENRWYKFFFKVLGNSFLMALFSIEGLKLGDIQSFKAFEKPSFQHPNSAYCFLSSGLSFKESCHWISCRFSKLGKCTFNLLLKVSGNVKDTWSEDPLRNSRT